ncbi:DUF6232 family protein [Paraburkholderia sp. BL10I2N1]|uniref:DUF6232 family protein n=1 Tax=Paraburkholderia sp. BL10I2N1 TaxID=1938796 RepID=UPI001060E3C9|nr:DUF6232 family protein [Paraburkholderia sp. BL10I2N1]TDN63663.1 hypothetical protein B0G77_7342 [Paraburkholderia sp. BL10I2N1]
MELPFNERGVSVTRNSLSAAGQVFALREIQNVRVETVQRNRTVPLVISLVGLAGAIVGGAFGSAAGLVCGVMVIVVGVLSWFTQDITHRLIVETTNGDREALSSIEREFVERVEQTVLQAKAAMQTHGATAATKPEA